MSFHVPAHKNVDAPAGQVSFEQAAGRVQRPDFRVYNAGSIILLTPLNPEARAHLEARMPEDVAMHGNAYAIEPRYFDAIVADLRDADFNV